jgi:hypothetical protein
MAGWEHLPGIDGNEKRGKDPGIFRVGMAQTPLGRAWNGYRSAGTKTVATDPARGRIAQGETAGAPSARPQRAITRTDRPGRPFPACQAPCFRASVPDQGHPTGACLVPRQPGKGGGSHGPAGCWIAT